MNRFNYNAAAELFPSRRFAKTQVTQYRRFARASDAIQHCIEEMPATALAGSYLEVNEQRFEGEAIRALYDAPDYPLKAA
ncbi:MAG: hypothetical protein JWR75_1038 [Devosia sp.]|nr:hypothetical protein [Devosia sp.]